MPKTIKNIHEICKQQILFVFIRTLNLDCLHDNGTGPDLGYGSLKVIENGAIR